jgi:hypothetical protein
MAAMPERGDRLERPERKAQPDPRGKTCPYEQFAMATYCTDASSTSTAAKAGVTLMFIRESKLRSRLARGRI